MSKTESQAGARTQFVRQDKNSNGSCRYTLVFNDGTEQVVRWRANGNYSHVLIGAAGVSFRSQPAPSTKSATCFAIRKAGSAAVKAASQTINPAPVILNPDGDETMSEYVAQNGEIDDLRLAIQTGENTLLAGPTGCGKTHLVLWVAQQLGREVVTLQGGEGMLAEHMVGYRGVENGATQWNDGLATAAARKGAILYCDEPNALPDGVRFYLFSLMDGRKEITLAENNGEVVKAAKGFVVVGAMNEGQGYSGTSLLNYAFRRRFPIILDLDYLPLEREAKLIADRSGATETVCTQLATVAQSIRAANARGEIKTPCATPSLLACAKLIKLGYAPLRAAALTVVAQVPASFAAERKAVSDVLAAHFMQERN